MGFVNDVRSYLASIARVGFGLRRAAVTRQPGEPLVLYEFEACPYCRKVREALCHLDLDVEIRPVPKKSPRRAELVARGGKMQAPYLVDPNTGREMYESDDIVRYLYTTYGDGRVPRLLRLGALGNFLSFLATAVRVERGLRVIEDRKAAPERPLVLYNMESSPYCRKVREALCELDIVYLNHNVPKGSRKRDGLELRAGKVQVPYLVDPNAGREMFESDDIVAYLHATYGA